MSERIAAKHLERTAVVYIRQSTMQQVVDHRESGRRQRELSSYAQELGFTTVVEISEDQGQSGAGKTERAGFGRLLDMICQGKVGAVFALEASRLARNNRDWHHLVDLCGLTGTLVIDYDGVYDPRVLNDRMLLGLKGTFAEYELGIMRQRAREALLGKIKRGEVVWDVPAGYVRTDDNRYELTPDRRVREAIGVFFERFRQAPSARQVLRQYQEERLLLPVAQRGSRGQRVRWVVPTSWQVGALLKNPVYAGAFVYGRRCQQRELGADGTRRLRSTAVPVEEWQVLIRDHHEGYIGWEEYLKNQQKMAENYARVVGNRDGRCAPRRGPALLAGLVRCRRCGRRLHVRYGGSSGRQIRYTCVADRVERGGVQSCIVFGGGRVERAVVDRVLEVLEPVGLQAAVDAWQTMKRSENEVERAVELALQQAEYEAERLRRQYDRVEPENRLVAADLETRWNEALVKCIDLRARLEQARAKAAQELTESDHAQLVRLGSNLRVLWDHPGVAIAMKKRLVRTVVEEIVADVDTDADPPQIRLWIHWVGGDHTELSVPKNRTGERENITDRQIVELVRELAVVCDDRGIAAVLNRLGYRTGKGLGWSKQRVAALRSYNKITAASPRSKREWVTASEAAELLGVSRSLVSRLLADGTLPGKQAVKYAPWVIKRQDLELDEVKAAVEAATVQVNRPRTNGGQRQLPYISSS